MSVLCPFLKLNWLGHVFRNISDFNKIADSNNLDIKIASAIGLYLLLSDKFPYLFLVMGTIIVSVLMKAYRKV